MGCGKQNKANSSNTDINEWYDHFKDLFANNDIDDNVQDASQFDNSEESDHFLNEEITELEVQKAIKKLKCGKSMRIRRNYSRNVESGRTGCGAFFLLGCLMYCLKRVFTHRIGPRQLLSQFIKKGNTEHMDNYRGGIFTQCCK